MRKASPGFEGRPRRGQRAALLGTGEILGVARHGRALSSSSAFGQGEAAGRFAKLGFGPVEADERPAARLRLAGFARARPERSRGVRGSKARAEKASEGRKGQERIGRVVRGYPGSCERTRRGNKAPKRVNPNQAANRAAGVQGDREASGTRRGRSGQQWWLSRRRASGAERESIVSGGRERASRGLGCNGRGCEAGVRRNQGQ